MFDWLRKWIHRVSVELYCFECKEDSKVLKIYAWQLKDALDLEMKLTCGHELHWIVNGHKRGKRLERGVQL